METVRNSSTMKTPAPRKTPRVDDTFMVFGAILLYVSTSLAMVYFNWWLFTSSFKYPVFVSWIQQVTGVALFYLFAAVSPLIPFLSDLPCVRPSAKIALKILPLSVAFVTMVASANICLKYVQVSTYQVARSLTIMFTIILGYFLLGIRETRRVLGSCAAIVLGFAFGSLDPTTLSFTGLLSGSISSLAQAMYNVIIKRTLSVVEGDTNVMLVYNQMISSFLFLPIVFFSGEMEGLHRDLPLSVSDSSFVQVWLSLGFSGLLAALMNLSAYLCVKLTSPLTFNIIGFTKAVVQSGGGFIFLGDIATPQSLVGIGLSLFGTGLYSFVKMRESEVRSCALVEEEMNLKAEP